MKQVAQICPLCEGSGKYKEKTCHACGGRGIVLVWEEFVPPFYYWPPTLPAPQPCPPPYEITWESGTYSASVPPQDIEAAKKWSDIIAKINGGTETVSA